MKKSYRLWKALGITWFMFVMAGIVISVGFALPKVTVLIDRSYCPTEQWQKVATQYSQIYQQREAQITSVVLFSDLGIEERAHPPTPAEVAGLSTYGRTNPQRQQDIQRNYSSSRLLTCRF